MCFDELRARVVLFGGAERDGTYRNDAWAWDGQNWTQLSSAPMSGRIRFGISYDVSRDRVIVSGGMDASRLILNETWEYDGTVWRPGPTSPPRADQHTFYDRVTSRVVVFGGIDDQRLVQGDTWAYTGANWVRLSPAASPPARAGGVCAYDTVRQRAVVSLGQGLADTWEWDGTNWHLVSPGDPARSLHSLSRDSAGLMAYGGRSGAATYADTWRYADGAWQRLSVQGGPGLRAAYALDFDGARRVAVLFGGDDGQVSFSDTWEWDGLAWSLRHVSGPIARRGATMAYWPSRGRMVLIGGSVPFDTWEYDGSTWRQQVPSASPPERAFAGLAYDPKRGTILLHGGTGSGLRTLVDTWEWDGRAWTQLSPAHVPPPNWVSTMVTDAARERIVLWGNGSVFNGAHVWEWDGSDWLQRIVQPRPSERYHPAMAYDPVSERVVLHGGDVGVSLGETWSYGPRVPARFTRHYVGCRSSVGAADLSATRPWLGEPVDFRLTGIPAGSPAVLHLGLSATTLYGIIPLPLDLTALGATGCSLYTDIALSLPMPSSATGAQLSLPLCLCPSLLGSVIYCQALAADPRANPAGLVTSNAGVAVLGGK